MKWLFVAFGIIGFLGCSETPIDQRPVPDEILFKPMRDEIASLENAAKSEWKSTAGSSDEIKSRKDLERITEGLVFGEGEWEAILADYDRAASVTHFGFDGNYHALAFFNSSQRPFRVEKW